MFKITLFSVIFPAVFSLYSFATMKYSIALTSLLTAVLIIAFWFVYKKYPVFKLVTYNSFIIFIALSLFAGKALGLYSLIPYWDKLLHFLSGFIFAQIGREIYLNLGGNQKNKILFYIFSLLFAFSIASFWEIWEFTGDKILNTTSQNGSLDDTMYDIILGSLSGIIKVFIIDVFFLKDKNRGAN